MKRIATLIFYTLLCTSYIAAQNLLWDVDEILSLTTDNPEYKSIIHNADKFLKQPKPVITEKDTTLSGDKNNYESLAMYFWPNPNDPTAPYIVKDGKPNPERNKYDSDKINRFSLRCKFFAQAYAVTREPKYLNAWTNDIKTWFCNEETRMNPNLNYAQIIRNRNNNSGQYFGIIDAYVMNDVAESICLMQHLDAIDDDTMQEIVLWFTDFTEWLRDSEQGQAMNNAPNNLSIAYDIMLCEFYNLTEQDDYFEDITNTFTTQRLHKQFLSDGSQPEEMKRAKPMSYCIYNLQHVLDFCKIMHKKNIRYYSKNRKRINAAINFIDYHITKDNMLNKAEEKQRDYYTRQMESIKKAFSNLK